MRKRPKEFFGPDDWFTDGDEEVHNAMVKKWDDEFAALPWWKRFLHRCFG